MRVSGTFCEGLALRVLCTKGTGHFSRSLLSCQDLRKFLGRRRLLCSILLLLLVFEFSRHFRSRVRPIARSGVKLRGMGSIDCATRWLVTISLVASLAVGGVFPRVTAWAQGDFDWVAAAPTECCCGTEDARCCGMGCCLGPNAPTNERCPHPNPNDTRDSQNNPLAFDSAVGGGPGDTSGMRFTRGDCSLTRSMVAPSLQAMHVRIDA